MARSVQFEFIGDAVRRLLTEEFVIDRLKARTSVRYTNTPSGLHRHSKEIPGGTTVEAGLIGSGTQASGCLTILPHLTGVKILNRLFPAAMSQKVLSSWPRSLL